MVHWLRAFAPFTEDPGSIRSIYIVLHPGSKRLTPHFWPLGVPTCTGHIYSRMHAHKPTHSADLFLPKFSEACVLKVLFSDVVIVKVAQSFIGRAYHTHAYKGSTN